jgi:hypothetical protein
MKKLLFVLTISSLFVACKSESEKDKTIKELSEEVKKLRANSPSCPQPATTNIPWLNTLQDTTTGQTLAQNWANFASSNKGIYPYAFKLNAMALYHAVVDTPGITTLVFYLGLNKMSSTNALSLMYIPCIDSINGSDTTLIQKLSSGKVFNQSVPCPTCLVEGPLAGK